jgi:hypothetical protein
LPQTPAATRDAAGHSRGYAERRQQLTRRSIERAHFAAASRPVMMSATLSPLTSPTATDTPADAAIGENARRSAPVLPLKILTVAAAAVRAP